MVCSLFISCPVPSMYIKRFTWKKVPNRFLLSYSVREKKAERMLHQHLFSLTVVAVLVSHSWDSSTQVLKPFCGRLQINLSGDSSNLGSFTNWRIDEHYFRGDHYYYWLKCDYSFGWKSSLRWDEQRWKSSFSSHLYQLVPVHWTAHQRFFSLSMGMIRCFFAEKDG